MGAANDAAVEGLLFDLRRSIRYHDHRKGFYVRWHLLTNLLTIFMAGVALTDVLNSSGPTGWASCLIKASALMAAFLSAVDMLIGYQRQSSLHDRLKNEFADLEIQLSQDRDHDAAKRRRLEIEKNEPPTYYALDALCRNEQLYAEGYKKNLPNRYLDVGWFARATHNLFRWQGAVFEYLVKEPIDDV